jgi:hypothetical protein
LRSRQPSGNFLVPCQAEWLAAFPDECIAFPNGRHDDQVDSMTQFLSLTGARLALDFSDRDPRTGRSIGRQRPLCHRQLTDGMLLHGSPGRVPPGLLVASAISKGTSRQGPSRYRDFFSCQTEATKGAVSSRRAGGR